VSLYKVILVCICFRDSKKTANCYWSKKVFVLCLLWNVLYFYWPCSFFTSHGPRWWSL